jgi:protein-L-isoaspartate(D-aspartate) O-methyltransferase
MDEATVQRLRLVARLRDRGTIATPAVEEAMRRIPRHLFIPWSDGVDAYRDEAVMVKYDQHGSPISSASQPTMVAVMLEWLQVAPGHRVLEIGTGTGYNAALLSVLAGKAGSVVSVELEPDLADGASVILAHVVDDRVQVVVGDGRAGYAPGAPYDRVIVTTGATEVAAAWNAQLRDGGRLVVPIVDTAGVGSIVCFDKIGGDLVRGAESPCGFLPIRAPHGEK